MNRRTLFQAFCSLLAPWRTPEPTSSIVHGALELSPGAFVVQFGPGGADELRGRFPELMADWFERAAREPEGLGFTLQMVEPSAQTPKEALDLFEAELGKYFERSCVDSEVYIPSDGDPAIAESVEVGLRALMENTVYMRTELPAGSEA